MKKFYLFVFIILSGLYADAQIISFSGSSMFKYRLTQANTNNTIAKNSAGEYFKVDANSDGEIQVSEALNVVELNLNGYSAAIGNSLNGINYFTNLVRLDCHYNTITSLDITNLVNLIELDCSENNLTSLILSPINQISKLDCSDNQLTSIDTAILTNLTELNCSENLFTYLSFGYLPNLTKLQISSLPNLTTSLNLSTLPNLTFLDAGLIGLTTIDISSLTQLKNFGFFGNSATSFDFSNNPNLEELYLGGNLLTSINLSNLSQLKYLNIENNNLTALDLSNNPLLQGLFCSHNQIASLDLSNKQSLSQLYCSHNQLTVLDTTDCRSLWSLNVGYNQLVYLNLKNGSNEYVDVQSNPNLDFICTDEYDSNSYYYLYNNGYNFNTYCSFVPGGVFYTVSGNQKYDADNNGCNIDDLVFPNLNYAYTNGFISANYIADDSGNFTIPFQAGQFSIIPVLENPSYFSVSPPNISVSFPEDASPYSQSFCITPNGLHNDLEVTIIPIDGARPGFDANYIIVYKNKGTSMQSGNITLSFEDGLMDLVSSNPVPNSQSFDLLSWGYTSLQPFETRVIEVKMNVNSPMETPPVNIGDQLDFTVTINPLTGDEFLPDNIKSLKQIVVGSFDPNDKTCLEGNIVGPEMIGQYVHYVIRFENTGTYLAENIVVRDIINSSKFDINSLVPINSSHSFITRIEGSKVEFIFENIQLPFDDANNDGYIAFKIKIKPTLVIGDTFTNNANIYFDYNYPIVTNTASTTIEALENRDFEFSNYFSLFPNPANEFLNIKAKETITLKSIAIYNLLGQMVFVFPNANQVDRIDISNLKYGSYFIKLVTDEGTATTKFIKK